MRVLLDTFVWISFNEDKEFLKDFIKFYWSNDIEIVFSHGNFMNLARADEQDQLSRIMGMFADEYCEPIDFVQQRDAVRSEDPIILTKMHKDWYEYNQSKLEDYSDSEKVQTMFREGNFAEPLR